jgi:hypothetical protein
MMSSTIFASRFPKWAAVITILSAWVFMLLYLTDVQHKLQCKLTNLSTELALESPTRVAAVICATESSSDTLVDVVPQLLILLGDESETAKAVRRAWLTKREYTAGTVGSFALDAVRKATPDGANVEPIVVALVSFASRVKPRNSKSGEWEGSATETAKELLELLEKKYVAAGFNQQIAEALAAHAGEITNDNFWRIHKRAYLNYPIRTVAHQIDLLATGKSLAAKTFIAKFAEEQEAELSVPPRITPLPTLPMPDAAASASASAVAQQFGRTGRLREDKTTATSGWVTIWREETPASCTETLPLLCIAKPAADSAPLTWEQLDILDSFAGVVDARVALTAPIQGTQLTSATAANAVCEKQLGSEWRIAHHSDSMGGRVSPQAWRIANHHYIKGGVITARASNEAAFKGTLYWFATRGPSGNCWAQ